MIECLGGFPDNVVACAAKGRVTRRDYDDVLIPRVAEVLGRHKKIRCYYELGREFTEMDLGAVWEDIKVGFAHLARWERVAVVTDVDWIRISVSIFRFLMPGEVRVFPTNQAPEARSWIAAP
jgi:hypothetical protein